MNEIPGINKGEFGFEGTIKIQSWAGFQTRTVDSKELSDGTCRLSTGGDMVVDDPRIEDYHLNAYNYLIENQEIIKESILDYLFNSYPELQEQYGYDDDEKSEFMPDVKSKEEFKQLIGISNVHLMNVEKDGLAYVGYEIGCKWDDEHGIGFMTHKNRIIDFGGADTSFLTWVARKDLEPQNEIENKETQTMEETSEKGDKPWWKFW